MAAITRRLAFYDLRDWWLSDPRVAALLDAAGRHVFVPAAQQPETKFPYVRYNIRKVTGMPDYWMHTEYVMLDIYAMDMEDTSELSNILISRTGRGSDSAQELQRWVATEAAVEAPATPRPVDFNFHWLEFAGGGEFLPPDEEGAHHGRSLSFAINYSPMVGYGIR